MRRPGFESTLVHHLSKRPRACQKSYRGTLGLSSLSDSFRYLVIHPERHCLCAASSVNTSRLVGTDAHVARITSGSYRVAARIEMPNTTASIGAAHLTWRGLRGRGLRSCLGQNGLCHSITSTTRPAG